MTEAASNGGARSEAAARAGAVLANQASFVASGSRCGEALTAVSRRSSPGDDEGGVRGESREAGQLAGDLRPQGALADRERDLLAGCERQPIDHGARGVDQRRRAVGRLPQAAHRGSAALRRGAPVEVLRATEAGRRGIGVARPHGCAARSEPVDWLEAGKVGKAVHDRALLEGLPCAAEAVNAIARRGGRLQRGEHGTEQRAPRRGGGILAEQEVEAVQRQPPREVGGGDRRAVDVERSCKIGSVEEPRPAAGLGVADAEQ